MEENQTVTTSTLLTPAAYQVCGPRLERTNKPRWLALRREGLGGSDSAAALGRDQRTTPWQLWHSKVHGEPPGELGDEQAEWIEFGHIMEPVMRRLWRRRYDVPGRVAKPGMLASRERPWLRVNLDGLVDDCGAGDGPCLVECKNRSAYQAREWGDDADSVPDAPALQVHHGLIVTGLGHGHLLAAFGNRMLHYRIDADDVLHKHMVDAYETFWHGHVLTGVPPELDGTERTGKLLARLWQVDAARIAVATPAQSAALAAIRAEAAVIKERGEGLAREVHEIQQAMGDAEVLLDAEGRELATWKQNSTFRAKEFADEQPAAAAKYALPATRYDTRQLAKDDEALYTRYRARSFKIKKPREERS